MTRWEYYCEQIPMPETREVLPNAEIEAWLGEFGNAGWELAAVLPGGKFVFKRPLHAQ